MKISKIAVADRPVSQTLKRDGANGDIGSANEQHVMLDVLNMTDKQMAFIEMLACLSPKKHFLEVGVFKGVTTCMLAKIGTVVAVDWFKGHPRWQDDGTANELRKSFLSNLEVSGVGDQVTVLTGKSDDVLPHLANDTFGLVLIDANHAKEFAYRDIANTWNLIANDGWLMLDDYTQGGIVGEEIEPTVRQAWQQFAKENGLEDRTLFTPDDVGAPKLVAVKKDG